MPSYANSGNTRDHALRQLDFYGRSTQLLGDGAVGRVSTHSHSRSRLLKCDAPGIGGLGHRLQRHLSEGDIQNDFIVWLPRLEMHHITGGQLQVAEFSL